MKLIIVMAITTIPVSKEFHDWLKSKGSKGESYEAVIKRLIKPEHMEDLQPSPQSTSDILDEAGEGNS